jgi:RecB family exonuclease
MSMSYSFSSLGSFRNCPRQFKFNKIEKVKIPVKVNIEAYMGNAIHRVLQQLYNRGANKKLMPLEEVLKLYESEIEKVERDNLKVVSEYMGIDDYIEQGRGMLTNHYELYKPFDQGTQYGTEATLHFTLPGTNFKFIAKIDRLWKTDEGKIEICDFKTGKNLPKTGDIGFFYQMGLYQLAVMKNYPMLDEIEVAQYFLRFGEVVRDVLTPDRMDVLIEDIKQEIFAIQDAVKFDDFPTKETALCNYCDYFELCPAKRHKIFIEEDEDGENVDKQKLAFDKATELINKFIQSKRLKAEIDALKDDLDKLGDDLDQTKFEGKGGSVKISRKTEDKFVTKTKNPNEFADLSFFARELELDEFFTLDARSLMKEIFKKRRLEPEQMEKLEQYIITGESVRVTPTVDKDYDPDESDTGD